MQNVLWIMQKQWHIEKDVVGVCQLAPRCLPSLKALDTPDPVFLGLRAELWLSGFDCALIYRD